MFYIFLKVNGFVRNICYSLRNKGNSLIFLLKRFINKIVSIDFKEEKYNLN